MARHSRSMYLVTKVDGTILWANDSFCAWSQYTLIELQKMTWMELSSNDVDLKVDIELASELTPYNLSYSI